MVDTVFSLNEVCENLFNIVLKLAGKNVSFGILIEKFENVVKSSFNNFSEEMNSKLQVTNQGNAENNVAAPIETEKHIIVLKDKADEGKKFSTQSWSNVVKDTLNTELKEIPVEKSLLNKDGHGCLFFPNKTAQNEAKAVLEPLFSVTSDSRPKKSVMPKIKIFDVNCEVFNDKAVLKQAILDKNPGINDLFSNGASLEVVLVKSNYAIIKVSPSIRKWILNSGRVFIGMEAHKIRDHFQPLQCFFCQGFGHKQGSENCKHFNNDQVHTCLYCSGNHFSRDCRVKNTPSSHKCVNCCNSSDHRHKNNTCHTSTSFKCPFVIAEINALIRRANGLTDTEAKKLEIRRVSQ